MSLPLYRMTRKVLIADDDTQLASLVAEYLEARGLDVTCTSNAMAAYDTFVKGDFDLCILDVRMPMKSGFELAEEIRQVDTNVPIVFLTGEADTEQRIKGLTLGADDYLTKPFSFKELYLRIEAIFRRMGTTPENTGTTFSIGDYTLDIHTRTLALKGSETRLSEIETRLLEAFCKAPGMRVTRDHLLKSIWQDDAHLKGSSLNVYVTKLRKRLADDPRIEILNIHGEGYLLVVAGQD